ncbi:hypothetical protein [Niabella aquatica]
MKEFALTGGPYAEIKEFVSGYMVVNSDTMMKRVAMTKAHLFLTRWWKY